MTTWLDVLLQFLQIVHKYLLTFHSAIGKYCVPSPLLMLVKFFYISDLNIHQISIHLLIPSFNYFYRQELAFYRGYYRDRFDKSFQEVSFPLCLSCCWGGAGLVPLSVSLYHLSYSFTPSLKTHYFDLQVSLCPCEGRTTVQKQWFPWHFCREGRSQRQGRWRKVKARRLPWRLQGEGTG